MKCRVNKIAITVVYQLPFLERYNSPNFIASNDDANCYKKT